MLGFRFEHFGPERKRAKKSETISKEAWRTHNSTILELFSQKLGYEEIRERITTEKFQPSLRQLKAHLKQMGLSRYGPKLPRNNGQTASDQFLPAPNIAIASHDPLHFDVAMSEFAAEPSVTHVDSPYFQYHAASGPNSPMPSTVSAIDDASDTETDISVGSWVSIVDIPNTLEEANATQINRNPDSYNSRCDIVDLSYAFNTPIQELLRGRQERYDSRPLRALAKRFIDIATNEGIAVIDRTLAQVIQATQEIFASDEHDTAIAKDGRRKLWIYVSRSTVRDYAVVIHVSVQYSKRSSHGDSRLALRMKIASPQNFIVEDSLTLIICPGLRCSNRVFNSIAPKGVDEMRSLLNSGEISISCILANAEFDLLEMIENEVSEELMKYLIAEILELDHASSTSLPLLINFWEVVNGHIIAEIWSWFVSRWTQSDSGPEESFQEQFSQCSQVTSIVQRNGSRIDESISRLNDTLMYGFVQAVDLSSAQRLQLLQYLRQLGLSLEIRGFNGRTPLLRSISTDLYTNGQKGLGIISDFLSPEVNANLHAKDDMGRGYLRLAFYRTGFLYSESSWHPNAWFDFDYQSKLLALLLSKDETFRERAITPKETPRITELAFSAVAWDVWTSVFEQLNWDMEEMNTYRYRMLRRPMLSGILAPYEEARVQMLGQTRYRLGPDKVMELEWEYMRSRIGYWQNGFS